MKRLFLSSPRQHAPPFSIPARPDSGWLRPLRNVSAMEHDSPVVEKMQVLGEKRTNVFSSSPQSPQSQVFLGSVISSPWTLRMLPQTHPANFSSFRLQTYDLKLKLSRASEESMRKCRLRIVQSRVCMSAVESSRSRNRILKECRLVGVGLIICLPFFTQGAPSAFCKRLAWNKAQNL